MLEDEIQTDQLLLLSRTVYFNNTVRHTNSFCLEMQVVYLLMWYCAKGDVSFHYVTGGRSLCLADSVCGGAGNYCQHSQLAGCPLRSSALHDLKNLMLFCVF
jgi:hypothetical protein